MPPPLKGVEPSQDTALADVESKTGANNFLRMMAHRPEPMQKFMDFYGSVMGPSSLLDRRLKEIVYVAVSTVNECSYCASHHRKAALAAGISGNEIHEIETENNQHFSLKEQAALHYARELTRNASVGDDTRYRAKELFSAAEFVELTMIIGLANFTNRFNNGLAVPLDE
jgi:uncharacterized peroxidase-related enzyme